MMKKTDLAYMAGILDGEGCIYIMKHKPDTSRIQPWYDLGITLTMTNQWICELFCFSFGGGKVHRLKRLTGKDKEIYTWQISGTQAANMLKDLLPYLQLKKCQAELGIKFLTEKKARNRGRNPDGQYYKKPTNITALEEAEFILMKNLKLIA